jgi:hypothetical protein
MPITDRFGGEGRAMTLTHATSDPVRPGQQAYVIEVGETQAGLVNRRSDERYFTFIAASSAFHTLEGHRFATPDAAERAVRGLARGRLAS